MIIELAMFKPGQIFLCSWFRNFHCFFLSAPSAVLELTEPPSFALPEINPLPKSPRRISYERMSMTLFFGYSCQSGKHSQERGARSRARSSSLESNEGLELV